IQPLKSKLTIPVARKIASGAAIDGAATAIDDRRRLVHQVLVALAEQVLQLAKMRGHHFGRPGAIAVADGINYGLVRLDHVLDIALRIFDAVLITRRQKADRRPED